MSSHIPAPQLSAKNVQQKEKEEEKEKRKKDDDSETCCFLRAGWFCILDQYFSAMPKISQTSHAENPCHICIEQKVVYLMWQRVRFKIETP